MIGRGSCVVRSGKCYKGKAKEGIALFNDFKSFGGWFKV